MNIEEQLRTRNRYNDIPMVSVGISCYNHSKYIRGAIDSVVGQTYENLEVIITDDGSTDGSRDIIRRVVDEYKDPRIHCDLREKNTCFECMEDAYINAHGKYITGIGGDDMIKPEKIEKQVGFLESCGGRYQACFTWTETTGEEEERVNGYDRLFRHANASREDLLRELFWGNFLNAPSMLMLHDVYVELGGYDFTIRHLQDYELWLKFLLKYELYIMPEELTIYRLLPGSLSDTKSDDVMVRTAEEDEVIHCEIMSAMSDELFDRVFPDGNAEHHSHLDIMCRKVRVMIERANTMALAKAALRLYYQYRTEPGFTELLGERYGLPRAVMQQFAVKASPYGGALREMKGRGGQ